MTLLLPISSSIIVALVLVHLFLLGVQTWEHRRFARRRLGELDRWQPTGRAMVFVPCKGIDVELEENLSGFFRQDYDDYEITFVVESPWDPACSTIAKIMARHPHRVSHMVIAGHANACGQKVHNLRVAVRQKLTPQHEYLVFADSDSRPRPEWLRAMLGRLGTREERVIGAATGYRWLIPARATWANHVLYSINANVATFLGSRKHYPIWGGSWALRRRTFETVDLLEAWRGTLSDDLVATRVLQQHRFSIRYEPAAMLVSPTDGTFGENMQFLRRQYVISRIYLPGLWAFALGGALASNLGWMAAFMLLGWGILAGSWNVLWGLGACLAIYGLNAAKAFVRQDLIDIYVPDCRKRLNHARRFDVWAGPVVGLINTLVVISSCVGRRIHWRQITYLLRKDGTVEILSRQQPTLSIREGQFDESGLECSSTETQRRKAA